MSIHHRRCAALSLFLLLGSCYSLAQTPLTRRIRTEGATVVLRIWINNPGPVLSAPPSPLHDAIHVLLLYPVEIVLDTGIAVTAPFDPDFEIRWGPIGAVAAIVLPGVTLMPDFYLPPGIREDVVLEEPAFDDLVARVRSGDGIKAYHEIVGHYPWRGGEAAVLSVELGSDTPVEAAQPAAAADG